MIWQLLESGKHHPTNAMRVWCFIGSDVLVGIGKPATGGKFEIRGGHV